MAYHLIIDNGPLNWVVPAAADPDGLMETLKEAMEDSKVVEVAVEIATGPGQQPKNVKLNFNGNAVGTVALVDL